MHCEAVALFEGRGFGDVSGASVFYSHAFCDWREKFFGGGRKRQTE